MNLESLILGILCGISILILMGVSILTFDIFSQITNSPSYAGNTDIKKAHTYFLTSFVILSISIIVFVMGVVIVGYGKIKHGSGGKKYNKEEIIKEMKSTLNKIVKGKANKDQVEELKNDEEIIKSTRGGDVVFTFILFAIALLSLISLVLTSIGQTHLNKGKSASNISGNPDNYLTKATKQGWYVIGLSLLSLCIIILIVGIKISTYIQDKKILKQVNETVEKSD